MDSYWEPQVVQGFPEMAFMINSSYKGGKEELFVKFFCLQNSWILTGGESSWKA